MVGGFGMSRFTANQLKVIREERGFSQSEAAKYMHISDRTLRAIEANERLVTSDEIIQFSRIYQVDVRELLLEVKQKKVYLTDENGERIPVIDKKTGQQKVDKQNRKQWKCTTIKTNDWDDQKYGKLWRKELTDAINNANAELGLTQDHWEHRSFKEQGQTFSQKLKRILKAECS